MAYKPIIYLYPEEDAAAFFGNTLSHVGVSK